MRFLLTKLNCTLTSSRCLIPHSDHSDLKTVLTVYKVNLSGEIKNCASAVCDQKLSKNIPGDSVTVSLSSCLDVKPQVKKLSIKADLLIL